LTLHFLALPLAARPSPIMPARTATLVQVIIIALLLRRYTPLRHDVYNTFQSQAKNPILTYLPPGWTEDKNQNASDEDYEALTQEVYTSP
jgi:urocanate hydratase